MKVSVIVTAYNIENYIQRCLKSIINQTLKDIEIIVINDGSTDKTLYKINELASRDSRIKVIDQNNQGIANTRKNGLNKATGEYILFVDGDDWLEDDALYKLYSKSSNNDLDILIYNAFWSYDSDKEKKVTYNKTINFSNDPIKNLLLNNIMPGIVFKFIKRNYILENKIELPNNIRFGEDLATFFSLIVDKPKIDILDCSLYNYYQRSDSISRTYTDRVLDVDKALSYIKERLIKYNLYNEYRKEFEYLVFTHLFTYRIIKNDNIKYNQKKVYRQWKNRKIRINQNSYIKEEIKNEPISSRIRIKSYNLNYNLGIIYDFTRNIIKNK